MRPWQQRIHLPIPCLAWLLSLLLLGLSACGPAPSDHAPSLEPRASLGGSSEKDRPAPTQTRVRGPDALPLPTTPGLLLTESSRGITPPSDTRVQTAAAPADIPPSDECVDVECAQRAARDSWYAEVRENPDVTVRLQALELWAEQPGEDMDPVTYALVDEDEQVRERAQALWAQQFTPEAEADAP